MIQHTSPSQPTEISTWIPKVMISDQDSIHAIPINDIMFLEAQGSYTRIKTSSRDLLSSRPLREYERQLNMLPFYRSHHSFLVNLNYMTRYDKASRYIQLENGEKVAVSFRKKERLFELLEQNGMR